MTEPTEPDVKLRPDEAAAMIAGRPDLCLYCDEAGVWQPVRFKRKNKVIHLLLTRDDSGGEIIWWNGEFVALKPGDDVNVGIVTWRPHGKECAVRVADEADRDSEERLVEQIESPNFFHES